MNRPPESSRARAARFVLLVLGLVVLAAIVVQDFSPYIPRCILNRGQGLYRSLSLALTALTGGLCAALAFGRSARLVRILAGLAVSLAILEGGVRLIDAVVINRPGSPLGSHVNRYGLVLLRPAEGRRNSLGFNEDHDYAKAPPPGVRRVLLLGDSYTFGSGTTRDRAYAKVLERELAGAAGAPVEVMNAGVTGYSPVQCADLLAYLRREGFRYDAVVLSLYLGNDFTDEIARTRRRAIGGVIQREPDAAWLRLAHPLNSRTFRCALVIGTLLRGRADPALDPKQRVSVLDGGPEEADIRVPPHLLQQLETNYTPASKLAYDAVERAVLRIAGEAGAPFYLVLFPDRVHGDDAFRAKILSLTAGDALELDRHTRWIDKALRPRIPVWDLTGTLAATPRCYIAGDTHLNDRGNLVAGREVARLLAEHPPFKPAREPAP